VHRRPTEVERIEGQPTLLLRSRRCIYCSREPEVSEAIAARTEEDVGEGAIAKPTMQRHFSPAGSALVPALPQKHMRMGSTHDSTHLCLHPLSRYMLAGEKTICGSD